MTAPLRLVRDAEGLNSASWPVLHEQLVTPIDHFFVRSHAPTPTIDAATWKVDVDGMVDRPRSFSLQELTGYARREVTATLVCAGLRRNEFLAMGPLPGELPWGPEPASTGTWTGIRLGEVLRAVGVGAGARYVEFIGGDLVERQGQRFGFGASIEVEKALSDEVLLATELNGAPLPPDHGFPLRAVVPGWIGARSVKWLRRITLRADPSPNYFQSRAYRDQRQTNPLDPRDVSSGVALTEIPLNAIIVEPAPYRVLRAGPVRVRGWAIGGGGRSVASVEVSRNGGREWQAARLTPVAPRWAWSFWEATVELAPGPHELVARATDEAGTSQPPAVGATWNVKGYNNNAWHRVAVRAE
jgi:sulfite oxidase